MDEKAFLVLQFLQTTMRQGLSDALLLDLAANTAASCGEMSLAEQYWLEAIEIDAQAMEPRCGLGRLYLNQGRNIEAESVFRAALLIDPGNAEVCANLGLVAGDRLEAEKFLRQAVMLLPDNALLRSNLANRLADDNPQEAEKCYREAIALAPGCAAYRSNLGVLLEQSGRTFEAEESFRTAILLDPAYSLARLNLAYLLLSQGRFAEGWKYHEARLDPALPGQRTFAPTFSCPRYQGEDLRGKSILVWPEQGYGDEIQFCRYVAVLQEKGAARIVLACRDSLKRLFRSLPADVLSMGEAAACVCDYWIFSMSLPLYCATLPENIPAHLPYLAPQQELLQKWSSRLPAGFKVGLAWKGSGWHKNRSLPSLAVLQPILSIPGISFVSLQPGLEEDSPLAAKMLHPGATIEDFADTAAIIAQLDLVVSVDTAVAHLAGALARPCWVMIPRRKTDWRWARERSDTPWYPQVMRLFRQKGDWGDVAVEIAAALREKIAAPS